MLLDVSVYNVEYVYSIVIIQKTQKEIINKMVQFNVNECGDDLICKINIIENFVPYIVTFEFVRLQNIFI